MTEKSVRGRRRKKRKNPTDRTEKIVRQSDDRLRTRKKTGGRQTVREKYKKKEKRVRARAGERDRLGKRGGREGGRHRAGRLFLARSSEEGEGKAKDGERGGAG